MLTFSQVQNVRTMMANQAGNQMVQYSATSSGAVTPGAAGDEVRVDCCLMATDGRSVVTGSSLGPPQVWDMQVIQQAPKNNACVISRDGGNGPNFILRYADIILYFL